MLVLTVEFDTNIESLETVAPNAYHLFQAVLQIWPAHKKFIEQRLKFSTEKDIIFIEKLAQILIKIKQNELKECVLGYQWMCAAVLEEELYFRRNHQYRLTSFEEAVRDVYDNPTVMTKYMDGLLLSQVLWSNHTSVLQYFHESFLENISKPFQLLEVGPGHGIFLYYAMSVKNCIRAVGWDISQSSLDFTQNTLSTLSSSAKLTLKVQNIFENDSGEQFDVIVLSEILEHLENPQQALLSIKHRLAPGGRLFVNVPCNSPAPDHIFLFRSPDEVFDMIRDCGYQISESAVFPATGVSLQKACDKSLTISVVVVATV